MLVDAAVAGAFTGGLGAPTAGTLTGCFGATLVGALTGGCGATTADRRRTGAGPHARIRNHAMAAIETNATAAAATIASVGR